MSDGANEGKVLGIGGLFIRSPDPDGLARWYKEVLGVGPGMGMAGTGEGEASDWFWRVQGGDVVFQPFARDNDYFARDKAFMLNFRVSGIAALIARLEARGIAVEQRDEWNQPEVGRFARIHDPDANPIELWEPPAS